MSVSLGNYFQEVLYDYPGLPKAICRMARHMVEGAQFQKPYIRFDSSGTLQPEWNFGLYVSDEYVEQVRTILDDLVDRAISWYKEVHVCIYKGIQEFHKFRVPVELIELSEGHASAVCSSKIWDILVGGSHIMGIKEARLSSSLQYGRFSVITIPSLSEALLNGGG